MFESIGRGWKITKLSFNLLMEDKKLLVFPFLSTISAILLLIGFFFPLIITGVISGSSEAIGNILFYLVLFAYYIVTSFSTIFFNVALVYSLKTKIEGKDSSLGEALGFAMSKFFVILKWALLSAIVGMIMRAIENVSKKGGPIGKIIGGIVNMIIGVAWSILTFFVIPIIVYNDLGVIDTLKTSASTFKKTWGENFVAGFSTGLIFFALFCLWLIIGVILTISLASIDPLAMVFGVIILILGFVIIALISSTISKIYQTLLYLYAENGVVPPGFSEEEMQSLFRK